ncbi:hypothetical protein SCH4B_2053 [Ruegeria sp. TrichCH4B]|nr:hypothetical protein SCH4B_2053 [Ruegeria sp. TrichCH4B]
MNGAPDGDSLVLNYLGAEGNRLLNTRSSLGGCLHLTPLLDTRQLCCCEQACRCREMTFDHPIKTSKDW